MKKYIIIMLMGFLPVLSLGQSYEFSPGWAIGLKASTNGPGIEVIKSFTHWLDVRAGYEGIKFTVTSDLEVDDLQYESELTYKAGSMSVFGDFYPVKWFYGTVGIGVLQFKPEVMAKPLSSFQYGDIVYSPEEIGDVSYKIEPEVGVSPYLGIGFGRCISASKKVTVNFEIGSYYIGVPQVEIVANGMLSETANPIYQQAEEIEEIFKDYRFLPVVKFGISYKFYQAKKENKELLD